MRALREYPDGNGLIDVVIAGGGGQCTAGLEMYTALRLTPRPKRVTIFSAPSMSGVIALAGDVIRIVENGTIFLHHARMARDGVERDRPTLPGDGTPDLGARVRDHERLARQYICPSHGFAT